MKIAEIMERLSKPIPRELIQKKPTFSKGKKSGEVDTISWINTNTAPLVIKTLW